MQKIFPGVWRKGNRLFTESLVPDSKEFTKSIVRSGKTSYREWDPYRSKAAAAILRGLKSFPIKRDSKILYLGISSGSTASFFSDIIGTEGIIYGIEISERSIRDLNPVAGKRGNIVPILASAKLPQNYSWVEPVDIVYQDVATDDQSEILIRNCEQFLKPGCYAMIAIKARSIDVTRPPREIYRQETEKLRKSLEIIQSMELDPYEKDHMFVLLRKK